MKKWTGAQLQSEGSGWHGAATGYRLQGQGWQARRPQTRRQGRANTSSGCRGTGSRGTVDAPSYLRKGALLCGVCAMT